MKERLRCKFYIDAKKRQCNMTRKAHSDFCSEHTSSLTVKVLNGSQFKRVPCPIDPKHTVWEHKLQKHMDKCSSAPRKIEDSWFECDCNYETETTDKGTKFSDEEFVGVLQKIEKVYSELGLEDLPMEDWRYSGNGLQERFETLKEKNQKHIVQQSSMIEHLDRLGVLDGDYDIVEFGSGRSELSYYVHSVMSEKHSGSKNKFVFVDRGNPRMKFDAKLRDKGVDVKRLKTDIKDLKLSEVSGDYFGISKHLCGVATELTLRCCLNSKAGFRGLMVAMCCRHCCKWDQLLDGSKDWLMRLGFNAREFENVFCKVVSWATSNNRNEHFSGMEYQQRYDLGLKARRLVDESRVRGISATGLSARIVRYVQYETSPENVLLLVAP